MWTWIEEAVRAAGPWLLPMLGASAAFEYVFPPFPGDTVTVLGAWLALTGRASPVAVWAVVTAGSCAGALCAFLFGRWLGPRAERLADAPLGRWLLPAGGLERAEAQYRRWGPWLVLANRFVPVTRAFFFVFAGMSGMRTGTTLALGACSAAVWNALLLGAGWTAGRSLDRLLELQRMYTRGAVAVLAAGTVVALAVFLALRWRRRKAAALSQGTPGGGAARAPRDDGRPHA